MTKASRVSSLLTRGRRVGYTSKQGRSWGGFGEAVGSGAGGTGGMAEMVFAPWGFDIEGGPIESIHTTPPAFLTRPRRKTFRGIDEKEN
jgi:hypothetical protein